MAIFFLPANTSKVGLGPSFVTISGPKNSTAHDMFAKSSFKRVRNRKDSQQNLEEIFRIDLFKIAFDFILIIKLFLNHVFLPKITDNEDITFFM